MLILKETLHGTIDQDIYSEDMHQLIKIHESMIPLCQTSCLLYVQFPSFIQNIYGTFSRFKELETVKS